MISHETTPIPSSGPPSPAGREGFARFRRLHGMREREATSRPGKDTSIDSDQITAHAAPKFTLAFARPFRQRLRNNPRILLAVAESRSRVVGERRRKSPCRGCSRRGKSIRRMAQASPEFMNRIPMRNPSRRSLSRLFSPFQKLEQDDDDEYLNSPWADGGSLKRHFQGLNNISWRPH